MLSENQINIIIDTLKPYNPTKIGIFGSFARGENSPDSDIDILYSFKNTISLFKLVGIQLNLESQLNKKVDLVSEEYIHPKLKPYILNDLKIIYGN
ncbi:nucleotidyltransferase family protein [Moheibacter lacus]|uniref:Nucleotidyltransferase family protein n=1 Tax=Moheibacter lacus TaxID=2745851 RepID=A0A838ZRZ3_9FLAO|nr:nucleotidyltransferase family protein [Moheibacter lacus]MBA5628709.1 nucleotidyltransferase family protein [Moheibacter lacus]